MMLHRLSTLALLLLLWRIPLAVQAQDLTAIDSISIWPSRVYVVLPQDSLFTIHHVVAQAPGHWRNPTGTVSLEIYDLLVPAAAVQRLIPASSSPSNDLFIPGDTLLITLAILPTDVGTADWQPIALDTVPARCRLSVRDLVRDGLRHLSAYCAAGNAPNHLLLTRLNLFPVVRRQGQYWSPRSTVLTEYFLVRSLPVHLRTQINYAAINTKGPSLSRNAPWRVIGAWLPPEYQYRNLWPIGLVHDSVHTSMYSFWSRPPVGTTHPTLRYFGSGQFIYKPGIGLISGKYPTYSSISGLILPDRFDHIIVDGRVRLR